MASELRVIVALAMAPSGVASAIARVAKPTVIKPGVVIKNFAPLNPTVDEQPSSSQHAAAVENIALNGDKALMTLTSTDGLNTLLLSGSF